MSLSRAFLSSGARGLVTVAIIATLPAASSAQSTLSTQGFGYPTGQSSARADGTAGSVAEVDPFSPVNPASLASLGAQVLYVEAQPEFRNVSSAAGSDRTSLTRFPLFFAGLPTGSRWVFGLSASTLLDRTSASSAASTQIVGADTVGVTTKLKLNGAIDDVRLAAGLQATPWLQIGFGLHAITGRNLVSIGQSFTDTTTFTDFSQQRQLSYEGGALSAGATISGLGFRAAANYRYGGPMRVTAEDTVLGRGRVPDQIGASLAYTGIKNSTIAIRAVHDGWSSMASMGTPGLVVHDTWDKSIGADLAGPNIAGRVIQLRFGVRSRDLPFEAAGQEVSERSIAAGLGSGWAAGHLITDFSLTRADRSAADFSEKAWIMSIGITVRP